MSDSFYVTLPSNSSMKDFPNNTMSDYTTVLPLPIQLNGQYDVALTELNYSPHFSVSMGTVSIENKIFKSKYENMLPFEESVLKFQFKIQNGISDQKFCDQLNELIETQIVYYDVDIRQAFAYEKTSEKILEQVRKNNIYKKDTLDNNYKATIYAFMTIGSLNRPNYFILDSEDSILSEYYKKAECVVQKDLNKWQFSKRVQMEDVFKVKYIVCEPKFSKIDEEEVKRTALIDYKKDKLIFKEAVNSVTKREIIHEEDSIRYEYNKRKEFYNVLRDLYVQYLSLPVYDSITNDSQDSEISLVMFNLTEKDSFLLFFCTPYEKKYFYGKSIKEIDDLENSIDYNIKDLQINNSNTDSISYRRIAKRRLLWLKKILNNFPTIENYHELFTPFEKTKFKDLSFEKIIEEQKDYWQSNNYLQLFHEKRHVYYFPNVKYIIGKNLNLVEKREVLEYFDRESFAFPFRMPKFEVDSSKIKLVWQSSIQVDGGLAKIISNTDSLSIQPNRFYNFPNFLDIINYIVIYTDFIENQFFGDVISPILKIVPVKERDEAQLVSYFDNPHYVPVRMSRIDSINITLRDLQGEKIQFEDSFLFIIAKLHFKKR